MFVVLTGMVAVLGVATPPALLLGLFAATPWVWTQLVWTRLGPRLRLDPARCEGHLSPTTCPVESPPAPGPRPLVSALASLSTPALCRQWQASYLVLAATTDPAAREHIVALRRRYLDELDRRDPDAMVRWLAADLRPAATSPARHLTARPDTPPDVPQRPHPGRHDPLPGVSP